MAEKLIVRGLGSMPTVLDVIENTLGCRPVEDQVGKLSSTELKDKYPNTTIQVRRQS